MILLNIAAAA